MCLRMKVSNPSCVLAEGVHNGHEWVVTHNNMGYRCGYIKVNQGHPWHGNDWDDIRTVPDEDGDTYVDVHGGITFSEADTPCDAAGPDTGWWIGFDCAHAWDNRDPELVDLSSDREWLLKRHIPDSWDGTIKTQTYAESECRKLADQAAAIAAAELST